MKGRPAGGRLRLSKDKRGYFVDSHWTKPCNGNAQCREQEISPRSDNKCSVSLGSPDPSSSREHQWTDIFYLIRHIGHVVPRFPLGSHFEPKPSRYHTGTTMADKDQRAEKYESL